MKMQERKNRKNLSRMMTVLGISLVLASCVKPFDVKVTTHTPTEITSTSAVCGGEVTVNGEGTLAEVGICWATSTDPTVEDQKMVAEGCDSPFSVTLTGLESCMTYHVRAYAMSNSVYYYGKDELFTTLDNGGGGGNGGNALIGAINGLFSVSETQQVYFSQGNLQYQASTNTWRFAENQWDYVGTQHAQDGNNGGTVNGSDNFYISSTYSGWIDLFGWGTSGCDNGNMYYQPYNTESNYDVNSGYGYGPINVTSYYYDLAGEYANADWGVYNAISNGGNEPGLWRTLTTIELFHVFNRRSTISGIRYARAQVAGVDGVILLPDDWNSSLYSLNNTNKQDARFDSNVMNASQWDTLQAHGAVFLPRAGSRWGISIGYGGGYYWTASNTGGHPECAGQLRFDVGCTTFQFASRPYGFSVRLVRDVE